MGWLDISFQLPFRDSSSSTEITAGLRIALSTPFSGFDIDKIDVFRYDASFNSLFGIHRSGVRAVQELRPFNSLFGIPSH